MQHIWTDTHRQHILPDPESNLAFELKGNENKDQRVIFTSYLMSLIFISSKKHDEDVSKRERLNGSGHL